MELFDDLIMQGSLVAFNRQSEPHPGSIGTETMLLFKIGFPASTDGFPIHRDELTGHLGINIPKAGLDALAKLLRINQGKEIDHGLLNRNAIGQAQPLVQSITMDMGRLNHSRKRLHATKECTYGNEDHFSEMVFVVSTVTWVSMTTKCSNPAGKPSE